MDDTVNRLAKELAQAIRAAVAADPTVEACRAKARAAGYEMHLARSTRKWASPIAPSRPRS